MDFPKFPNIIAKKDDGEDKENPLLVNFFMQLNAQLMDEVSQLNTSCAKLKKTQDELLAKKDQLFREIFELTQCRMENSSSLAKQLPQQIQNELDRLRMRKKQVNDGLEEIQKDYAEWREAEKVRIKNTSANDGLFELTQAEIKEKIEALEKEAENTKTELNAFQEVNKNKTKLLEDDLHKIQEEINMLKPLELEMSDTHKRLAEEFHDRQLQSEEETKALLQKNDFLKKKLEIYE